MPARRRPALRQSTVHKTPARASDETLRLDSDRMEHHLTQIDVVLKEMRQALEVQFKRMAAMQAQLDHLSARHES